MSYDRADRSLRIGPLTVHTDGAFDPIAAQDGAAVFADKGMWFLAACGYQTWQVLAAAFEVPCWTGWIRVSGNAPEYGCWLLLDGEAARVFARLAHQDTLVEWTPTVLRLTSGQPDGHVIDIPLTDRATTAA